MKTVSRAGPISLERKVLDFVRGRHLVDKGARLVVAVSGGPDSVCLLNTLVSLRARLGVTLHVAHLDHGLRGADSAADAAYVAELARGLGLPATIERRDVRAYQAQQRLSPEEAAREVRYAFLGHVAAATGSQAVAVGHTLDDNVETILMHVVRGSGVAGLRGLLPSNELDIDGQTVCLVRPLLPVTREETAAYCQELGLAPRTDATNFSREPFRNRVRHELIPLLQSYNPRIKEALLRTAGIAADETTFLESEARLCWDRLSQRQPPGIVLRAGISLLPPAVQRLLLRRAVQTLAGTLKDFESGHVEDMLELLGKAPGKRLHLPDGLVFSVEYDCYVLSYAPAALCPFPEIDGELSLSVPGQVRIGGWSIRASVTPTRSGPGNEDAWSAYLDLDEVGNSITIRARRSGDCFQPLGMSGPVKLKDFMINAKVPRMWRPRVPVFASPRGIIWVGGWRIDERVKITAQTKWVLHLQMERLVNDQPGDSGSDRAEAPR